eukprot:Phypoly_transcript_19873.p1 GENE.Phypoly_transcript_19873~~Phypoly_transcript_19873.p1  ORF type:complete len:213 (+),score=33.40 Phypoly_transcript_19873:44-640(+)
MTSLPLRMTSLPLRMTPLPTPLPLRVVPLPLLCLVLSPKNLKVELSQPSEERGIDVTPFVRTLTTNLWYLATLCNAIPNHEVIPWIKEFINIRCGLDIVHITPASVAGLHSFLNKWKHDTFNYYRREELVTDDISGRCIHNIVSCLFALRPSPIPNPFCDRIMSPVCYWLIIALQHVCNELTPGVQSTDLVPDLLNLI